MKQSKNGRENIMKNKEIFAARAALQAKFLSIQKKLLEQLGSVPFSVWEDLCVAFNSTLQFNRLSQPERDIYEDYRNFNYEAFWSGEHDK
jgi:hypothetical protein